jgi:hypothetical protein
VFIVDIVAKAGSVNNGQGNTNALLLKFCVVVNALVRNESIARQRHKPTDIHRFYREYCFDVHSFWTINDFMGQNLRLAQGVHKSGTSCASST